MGQFRKESSEVLHLGAKGGAVIALQSRLQSAGFYRGEPTGSYDAETIAAVKHFQSRTGLVVNGVAGADTLSALDAYEPSAHPFSLLNSSGPQETGRTKRKRGLTAGEIAMCQTVFKDSIQYSKVKVHGHEYWLTLGFQAQGMAITPNGELYFNKHDYSEDFSAGSLLEAHWFMHEMVHVWQKHLGFHTLAKGIKTQVRSRNAYAYEVLASSKLQDYNMEQQGDILADYFLLLRSKSDPTARHYMTGSGKRTSDAEFLSVLSEFILNPHNKSLLPKTTRTRATGAGA